MSLASVLSPSMEMSEKMSEKPRQRKVVETVNFNVSGRKEDARKQSDELDKEYLRDALGVEPVPDRDYFYDFFVNMRAPAVPDRGLPSLEVFSPAGIRLANAAWAFGYRRHEDLATMMWLPSAGMGGREHSMDTGVYVYRELGEPWPETDVVAEIDPDDIVVEPGPGKHEFTATHSQSGRSSTGKSRIKAHKALIEQLEEIESRAALKRQNRQ